MKAFILALSGLEVVHLLRAETRAAHSQPEFDILCSKDYLVEEHVDHSAANSEERTYVKSSVAILTVEPRRESGYWILSVVVERALGLIRWFNENDMSPATLTLDEFEVELLSARPKEITVRLDVQTPDIRQDFDRWISEMRARHPWKPIS